MATEKIVLQFGRWCGSVGRAFTSDTIGGNCATTNGQRDDDEERKLQKNEKERHRF